MTPKRDLRGKTPYIALSKADAEQTSLMYNCPGKKEITFRNTNQRSMNIHTLSVKNPSVKSADVFPW